MKILLGLALLVASSIVSASSNDDSFRFSIALNQNDKPPVAVRLEVPRGETIFVTTKSGLRLEINAAKDPSEATQSTVRLLDVGHGEPRIIHVTNSRDSNFVERTISYTICGQSVEYSNSPTPDVKSCKQLTQN